MIGIWFKITVVSAVISGVLAYRKGRWVYGWVILTLFLSCIATIILAFLPVSKSHKELQVYLKLYAIKDLEEKKCYKEAINLCDKYIKRYAKSSDRQKFVDWKIHILSEDLDRYDDALKLYDESLRREPNNADIWKSKARFVKNSEDALKSFNAALRIAPSEFDQYDWEDLGKTFDNLGRYKEALEAYDKAAEFLLLNKEKMIAKEEHYGTWKEDRERAEETWERSIAGVYLDQARLCFRHDYYQEALDACNEGLFYRPEHASLLSLKGNIEAKMTEMERKKKQVMDLDEVLLNAAKDGNLLVLKTAIEKGADVNAKTISGKTALMIASYKGYTDIVNLLIEKGADVNAKQSNTGGTALMAASDGSHLDIVNLLIEKGADVNAKDNDGKTALMRACSNCHVDVVKYLIEKGVDINVKWEFGFTPLMLAARENSLDLAKLMIEKGVDINVKWNEGGTALMFAVARDSLDVAKLLIEKGADVNAKNDNGVTALMIASLNGYTDIVELLIEKGAEVNVKSKDGATALMIASEKGHTDVVSLLKNAGATQ